MNELWFKKSFYNLFTEWCRLKGYELPKTPISQMVDEATGVQDERMKEFVKWFTDEVLPRVES